MLRLHLMKHQGGSRWNFAIIFYTEKLDWRCYQKVEKFEDMFTNYNMIHECDRQTDRQTDKKTDTVM